MLVELSYIQPQIKSGVLLLVVYRPAKHWLLFFVCVGDAKAYRGLPGTDQNGEYLVRQLVDYANGMLNASSSYVIPIIERTAEVATLLFFYCICFFIF